MWPGDAVDGEMRRHPRTPVPPLDPAMAERILDGTVHEDDVPPGYRDVVRVLASAAASPSLVPPVEAAALATFRSARRPVDAPRRRSVLSKLLGAKAVAAAVLGTAAVGTAAAAATGTLPDAAQAKAHHIVAAVPDAKPAGHGAAAGTSRTRGGTGASDHPALPGVAGLCQAYGSGNGGGERQPARRDRVRPAGRRGGRRGQDRRILPYGRGVRVPPGRVRGRRRQGPAAAPAGPGRRPTRTVALRPRRCSPG